MPLFLAITANSELYPEQDVCQHLRLFHIAKLKVNIHHYPGDDALTTQMLKDMDRWIMDRMTGSSNEPATVQVDRSLN